MTGRMKAAGIALVVAAVALLLAPSAFAQSMSGKKGGHSGASTETKPKVDDKAYKAALERIPEPKEKYDPWGVTKPADPAKDAVKKPKQTP